LQLLIAALQLDKEQQNLLVLSRRASTAGPITAVSFPSQPAEHADDALENHITFLRTSEQHLALVDALLVRAMIALRERRWHAAMDDLDETIALAREMPYPVAELKALAIYGQLYTAMGTRALGALIGDSLIALAGYGSLFLVAAVCYGTSILQSA
jgi:hypothetical protein